MKVLSVRLQWLPAALMLLLCSICLPAAKAQEKGEPGKFDYFLLNLSWSPEFCATHATNPQCPAHPGFIVHGLWPQNTNGPYPVSCSDRPGPAHPEQNLDITPDLSLLQHEWEKHGTCTALEPDAFFALEHKAFHSVAVPKLFSELDQEVLLKPDEILGLFQKANPTFPKGSIILSCGNNRLTAIELCMAKDDLHPIACSNVPACHAQVVRITPRVTKQP